MLAGIDEAMSVGPRGGGGSSTQALTRAATSIRRYEEKRATAARLATQLDEQLSSFDYGSLASADKTIYAEARFKVVTLLEAMSRWKLGGESEDWAALGSSASEAVGAAIVAVRALQQMIKDNHRDETNTVDWANRVFLTLNELMTVNVRVQDEGQFLQQLHQGLGSFDMEHLKKLASRAEAQARKRESARTRRALRRSRGGQFMAEQHARARAALRAIAHATAKEKTKGEIADDEKQPALTRDKAGLEASFQERRKQIERQKLLAAQMWVVNQHVRKMRGLPAFIKKQARRAAAHLKAKEAELRAQTNLDLTETELKAAKAELKDAEDNGHSREVPRLRDRVAGLEKEKKKRTNIRDHTVAPRLAEQRAQQNLEETKIKLALAKDELEGAEKDKDAKEISRLKHKVGKLRREEQKRKRIHDRKRRARRALSEPTMDQFNSAEVTAAHAKHRADAKDTKDAKDTRASRRAKAARHRALNTFLKGYFRSRFKDIMARVETYEALMTQAVDANASPDEREAARRQIASAIEEIDNEIEDLEKLIQNEKDKDDPDEEFIEDLKELKEGLKELRGKLDEPCKIDLCKEEAKECKAKESQKNGRKCKLVPPPPDPNPIKTVRASKGKHVMPPDAGDTEKVPADTETRTIAEKPEPKARTVEDLPDEPDEGVLIFDVVAEILAGEVQKKTVGKTVERDLKKTVESESSKTSEEPSEVPQEPIAPQQDQQPQLALTRAISDAQAQASLEELESDVKTFLNDVKASWPRNAADLVERLSFFRERAQQLLDLAKPGLKSLMPGKQLLAMAEALRRRLIEGLARVRLRLLEPVVEMVSLEAARRLMLGMYPGGLRVILAEPNPPLIAIENRLEQLDGYALRSRRNAAKKLNDAIEALQLQQKAIEILYVQLDRAHEESFATGQKGRNDAIPDLLSIVKLLAPGGERGVVHAMELSMLHGKTADQSARDLRPRQVTYPALVDLTEFLETYWPFGMVYRVATGKSGATGHALSKEEREAANQSLLLDILLTAAGGVIAKVGTPATRALRQAAKESDEAMKTLLREAGEFTKKGADALDAPIKTETDRLNKLLLKQEDMSFKTSKKLRNNEYKKKVNKELKKQFQGKIHSHHSLMQAIMKRLGIEPKLTPSPMVTRFRHERFLNKMQSIKTPPGWTLRKELSLIRKQLESVGIKKPVIDRTMKDLRSLLKSNKVSLNTVLTNNLLPTHRKLILGVVGASIGVSMMQSLDDYKLPPPWKKDLVMDPRTGRFVLRYVNPLRKRGVQWE